MSAWNQERWWTWKWMMDETTSVNMNSRLGACDCAKKRNAHANKDPSDRQNLIWRAPTCLARSDAKNCITRSITFWNLITENNLKEQIPRRSAAMPARNQECRKSSSEHGSWFKCTSINMVCRLGACDSAKYAHANVQNLTEWHYGCKEEREYGQPFGHMWMQKLHTLRLTNSTVKGKIILGQLWTQA